MLRFLTRWTCLAYAAGFVVLEVVRLTEWNQHWIPGLAVVFWLWLFLPLPILLVVALAYREVVGLAALAVPMLLFVSHFGPFIVPKPAVASADEQGVLRVVTANLYNNDLPSIIALTERNQPDLLLTQEVTSAMATRMQVELGAEWPHALLDPHEGTRGMGILSRYPLQMIQPAAMGPGECSCQAVLASTSAGPVLVINIHPLPPVTGSVRNGKLYMPQSLDTSDQEAAFAQVRAIIQRAQVPVIVAGDFNATDRQPHFLALKGNLQDAFRKAGLGFGLTFPHLQFRVAGVPVQITPVIRIDYILADPRFEVVQAWKGRTPGSDHDHVLADLRLRN